MIFFFTSNNKKPFVLKTFVIHNNTDSFESFDNFQEN